MPMPRSLTTFAVVLSVLAVTAVPAFAVDGVILIDQNRAMAGGVTPGDSAGFPVTISVSGSYRLSGNLTVPNVDTTAIDITNSANAVTIDLNGFSINGPVSCELDINQPGNPTVCNAAATDGSIFGPGVGIRSLADETLTVRNGTIRGMGRFALFQSGGAYVIIENVHARENALGGIWPSSGTVINTTATFNGAQGIIINAGVIRGTVVSRNVGDGIVSTGLAISVIDSQINSNGGFGINFSSGGVVANSMIHSNAGGAIDGTAVKTGNHCTGTGC
jgi:hypothetical protein